MANATHLEVLRSGVKAWNAWRKVHRRGPRSVIPDLSDARLDGMNLRGYDLSYAHMRGVDLSGGDLSRSQARFAILSRAKLIGTKLRYADLRGASLRRAILRRADLTGAILRHASLAEADIQGAKLHEAEVYGAGVWGLKGKPKDQSGLIIQATEESPPITVDDLDTAQFLFVLLDNPKIANVIDTASSRTVLILGRFTPARKRVLDAVRTRVLKRNFVPLLFDFKRSDARDLTETVASLAHMVCFIIADLTDAKSIPQELSYIIPYLPSVPVVPLIGKDERPYAMFEHFTRYKWVQPVVKYQNVEQLLSIFDDKVLRVGFREAMHSRGARNKRLPKLVMKPQSNEALQPTAHRTRRG